MDNNFKLGPITGELGTVVQSEITNLAGANGELAKVCAEFKSGLESLGFKITNTTWAFEAGGRNVTIPVTRAVHA